MSHEPTQRAHALAQRLLPGCLAIGMSGFVAAVVTLVNTGATPGLATRWLHAWALACPAAIVAAYLLRPIAWRLALAVARLFDRASMRSES